MYIGVDYSVSLSLHAYTTLFFVDSTQLNVHGDS